MSSRIALGTAQFGLPYGVSNLTGQVSLTDAEKIIEVAAKHSIDMIDTAIAYGESEMCLGQVGISAFKVITKLPSIPDNCVDVNDWVKDQFNASLKRLGVPNIYGILLHQSQQLLGPYGRHLFAALKELKDCGSVKKIGVSIYSPNELDDLFNNYSMDLVQAPLNLIDRRLHTSGWLQRLSDNGIEVHTRSAFLQGLLLMPQSKIPLKFHKWNYLWEKWHCWLRDENISAAKACIDFPLSFPQVDRVVVGVDSVNQLEQVISSSVERLTVNIPDIIENDENLVNPFRWNSF